MTEHEARIDAVARCLAKCESKHIGANDWVGHIGDRYRMMAREALATLERFNSGVRSGGLPSVTVEKDAPGTRVIVKFGDV